MTNGKHESDHRRVKMIRLSTTELVTQLHEQAAAHTMDGVLVRDLLREAADRITLLDYDRYRIREIVSSSPGFRRADNSDDSISAALAEHTCTAGSEKP